MATCAIPELSVERAEERGRWRQRAGHCQCQSKKAFSFNLELHRLLRHKEGWKLLRLLRVVVFLCFLVHIHLVVVVVPESPWTHVRLGLGMGLGWGGVCLLCCYLFSLVCFLALVGWRTFNVDWRWIITAFSTALPSSPESSPYLIKLSSVGVQSSAWRTVDCTFVALLELSPWHCTRFNFALSKLSSHSLSPTLSLPISLSLLLSCPLALKVAKAASLLPFWGRGFTRCCAFPLAYWALAR